MFADKEEQLQWKLRAVLLALISERNIAINQAKRAIVNTDLGRHLDAKHNYRIFDDLIKDYLAEEEADTKAKCPKLFEDAEFPEYSTEQHIAALREKANHVVFSDGSIVADDDVPF